MTSAFCLFYEVLSFMWLQAIKACGPDTPFNVIGSKIQRHAKNRGLTVLPAIIGHGIGAYFHGPPDVYHISKYLILHAISR